jgi:hypothetical protein
MPNPAHRCGCHDPIDLYRFGFGLSPARCSLRKLVPRWGYDPLRPHALFQRCQCWLEDIPAYSAYRSNRLCAAG